MFICDAKSVTFIGMKNLEELNTLLDEYRVPGFKTMARVQQDERDPTAFALTLVRRQKKRYAARVGKAIARFMIVGSDACVTSIAESEPSTLLLSYGALTAHGAA